MLTSLLVISIILLILFIFGFILIYSFYFNSNNKLYHKLKFNYSTWGIFCLLILIFLLVSILITINYTFDKNSIMRKNMYLIPISWLLFLLSVLLSATLLIIKNKINKTRLNITNFRQEDFKSRLNIILNNFNYEDKLKQKYPRYYSILKQKQEIIMKMMQTFSNDNYQNILTELIMFNETMATKWSNKNNSVQLKIFYEMCVKLQTISN